jgi:hypothetical protein
MGINRKIGAAITTTMLLALNVSSSPPATAIFRPSCTENSRGIGDVSATSTHNSVTLLWNSPGYAFQTIHVCYKKNWALQGKCDGGRHQYETYGSPVSGGTIRISSLDNNSCYKFAVYGVDAGDRLIGQEKIRTNK